MDAYKKVQLARGKNRPTGRELIDALITDFTELHGDRRFGDDPAIVGGIGRIIDLPLTVIAHQKGRDTREKVACNFGCAHPEGYRKALRLMKQAEKFGRPILCLVDTSGAYCGLGAEERGQAQAIAENLVEMMSLQVPILTLLVGEGGSGGALALAVADEVWMLENSVYSVISPEGCASILWKDASRVKEASQCLRLTAQDLLGLHLIQRIVKEPASGDFTRLYPSLQLKIHGMLTEYGKLPPQELTYRRYDRFRRMGICREG